MAESRDLDANTGTQESEDDDVIVANEEETVEATVSDLCLVGKLWTAKRFNSEALMRTLTVIWRTSKGVEANEIGKNLFSFRFFHWKDKRRVMEGGPWQFDKRFLVLKEMDKSLSPDQIVLDTVPLWVRVYDVPIKLRSDGLLKRIGNKIGEFVCRDEEDCNSLGAWIRMKVNLKLSDPLVPVVKVKDPDGRVRECKVRFEKLAIFCYCCGRVGHTFHYCDVFEAEGVEEEELPYKSKMRASPTKTFRKSIFDGEPVDKPIVRKMIFEPKSGEIGGKGKVPPTGDGDRRKDVADSVIESVKQLNLKGGEETSRGLGRESDGTSFLDYVHNRQVVHFRTLERPKEDEFCLELSKLHTYDDVVERVARHLGLDDPSKIRLTPHNCYSQQPKLQPIRHRGVDHLSDMLVHYNQSSDILYYEALDIPLPELQGLKTLKVAFHHATKDEVTTHSIRLPRQSTVGDVLSYLKSKVDLSHPSAEIRLLEVFYHKIYKIFPVAEKIENINDQYWTLRAEETPEDEKDLGPRDRLIHVYHFTKETTQNQVQIQNFGDPFLLVIHEGETLTDVKARVQKKLLVPDEEFAKWKFAFISLGRPEYLQDSDILSDRFQRRDVYGAWEEYLGLEHSDTASKRIYTANQSQRRRRFQPTPVLAGSRRCSAGGGGSGGAAAAPGGGSARQCSGGGSAMHCGGGSSGGSRRQLLSVAVQRPLREAGSSA